MSEQPVGTYVPFVRDNAIYTMDTRNGEIFELKDKDDYEGKAHSGHHMYQWIPVPAAPVDDIYDRESLRAS